MLVLTGNHLSHHHHIIIVNAVFGVYNPLFREDKFKVDGVWHTWIDYEKYHQLITAYYESNGTKTFTSEDYMAVTPDWALYKVRTTIMSVCWTHWVTVCVRVLWVRACVYLYQGIYV